MSHRDEIDALFQHARLLQTEIDRQRSARMTERSHAETVESPVVSASSPPAIADADPLVESWPPPRSCSIPPESGAVDGLMVARLTPFEHAMFMRVLEVTGDDDSKRRQRAFNRLVADLRQKLA